MAEKSKAPASRRLFELKCGPLKVDYCGGTYSVCYLYAGIKKAAGIALTCARGKGPSFEEACGDYLRQIRGETMVIHMPGVEWQEVEVPAEA